MTKGSGRININMLQYDFDECFLKIDRRLEIYLEIYFKFILENCERMLYNNKSTKDNPILSIYLGITEKV